MIVFSALALFTGAIALLDVRRSGSRHPLFGLTLAAFSSIPPLGWFAFAWGMADSGAWDALPRMTRWFYGITNALAVLAMPGCLFSSILGIGNMLTPVRSRLLLVSMWAVVVPALLVSLHTGVPSLWSSSPAILVSAGSEVGFPSAVVGIVLAGMSLFVPRSDAAKP